MRILPESQTILDSCNLLNVCSLTKTPLVNGTSDNTLLWKEILSIVRLIVSKNDPKSVLNKDRFGRSIHYININ